MISEPGRSDLNVQCLSSYSGLRRAVRKSVSGKKVTSEAYYVLEESIEAL